MRIKLLHTKTGALAALALLLTTTSCSISDASASADDALRVEAEIAGTTPRTTNTADEYDKRAFVAGDMISISNGVTGYTYKKNSDGIWIPTVQGSYHTISSGINFTATYPTDFTEIKSDQGTATTFLASNRLQTPSTPAVNNTVSFTKKDEMTTYAFTPTAAKISIVVNYTNAYTPESAMIEASGICTEAGKTGNVNCLYTAGDKATATKSQSWACIVNPTTYASLVFTVKTQEVTGTNTYSRTLTLKAGFNYIFNFSSGSDLVLTGVSVKPFTDTAEEGAGSAT